MRRSTISPWDTSPVGFHDVGKSLTATWRNRMSWGVVAASYTSSHALGLKQRPPWPPRFEWTIDAVSNATWTKAFGGTQVMLTQAGCSATSRSCRWPWTADRASRRRAARMPLWLRRRTSTDEAALPRVGLPTGSGWRSARLAHHYGALSDTSFVGANFMLRSAAAAAAVGPVTLARQ